MKQIVLSTVVSNFPPIFSTISESFLIPFIEPSIAQKVPEKFFIFSSGLAKLFIGCKLQVSKLSFLAECRQSDDKLPLK